MARILYFSHPSRISHPYEKLYHVSPTRSFWMGAELARLGHEVVVPVYGDWPPAKEPPHGMKFVPFADIPQSGGFDLVFCHLVGPSYRLLLDCAFAGQYERRAIDPKAASKLASCVSELPVFLQSDHPLLRVHRDDKLDEFGKSRVRAVGLSAPNAACGIGCRSFYCPPAAVPDRPDAPPPPDPYASSRRAGRPVVVYLGRLNDNCRPSMSQRLDDIARATPEADFYIISGKVRGGPVRKTVVVHDDDEDRDAHRDRVTLISDLFTAANVTFLPTPSYDRTFGYLMHADLGVALSVRVGQDIASCKMWEYVSCGLPAVCDDQLPEASLCRTYGLSDPFPFGSARGAADAIRRALRGGVDRADLIRRMRREHSYHERAGRWSSVLQDAGFGQRGRHA